MANDSKGVQRRYLIEVRNGEAIGEVSAALASHGVEVHRVMARLGIIDAQGPADVARAIRSVPGVALVREEGLVQLPPFDERIPQ